MERKTKAARFAAAWLAVCALCLPLLLGSCGSDEYEKPSTTQTPTALISAATLKEWMDAGKVNGTGYDRVVILDVNLTANYTTAHIPGALWVDSAVISETRNEGVADTNNMVLKGLSMNTLIQRLGIDGSTTIVLTGGAGTFPIMNVTYVYWTFRYWGFPKNRLKILDGLNNAANMAILGTATGAQPTVASSTYSVTSNGTLRKELRASLAEMIGVAEGGVSNARILDARHNTPVTPAGSIAFEGSIKGAQLLPFNSASIETANVFASADIMAAAFVGKGVDSTTTAYVYCATGARASVLFFALDGILGWPAVVYDGSWNQWGTLAGANPTAANNNLPTSPPYSSWQTDLVTRAETITYNSGVFTPLASPKPFAPSVNLIEEEDLIFMRSGSGTGGGSGGGGTPSGC